MAENKTPTYSEAMAELEQIVRAIEGEGVDVEDLTESVKRARFLITYCKGKLRATEDDVRRMLAEMQREGEPGAEAAEGPETAAPSSPPKSSRELF